MQFDRAVCLVWLAAGCQSPKADTAALTSTIDTDPPATGTGAATGTGSTVPVEPSCAVDKVVMISSDTTRQDHLGMYGYGRSVTPNLDAFAADGVVFDRAWSHAPWTKPSFGSTFTSMLPGDHGVTQWETALDDSTWTLAKALQGAGVRTHAIISHVAFDPARNNFHPGWDVFDTTPMDQGNPHELSTAPLVTDLALEALDDLDARGGRYVLWVHYFDAHADYLEQPAHVWGPEPIDLYDGEINWIDTQVGRLLARLQGRDDTAVVFFADHGEEFRDHGGLQHTSTVYDELVRVPFVVRHPAVDPGRSDEIVKLGDVAPTVLTWLELPVPDHAIGAPLVCDEGALRVTSTADVFHETRRFQDKRGMVRWPHKVVRDLKNDTWELYDLAADPRELTDLSTVEVDTFDTLRDALLQTYPE